MIPHWLEESIKPLEKRLSKHPRSPLFAQLANFYLEAGRAEDALRVCDEGLAHHPFYATGHLMKGKALLALKMTAEARREFELVHDLLPSVESVARLLSETGSSAETELTAAPAPPVALTQEATPTPASATAGVKRIGAKVKPAETPVVETPPPVVEEPPPVITPIEQAQAEPMETATTELTYAEPEVSAPEPPTFTEPTPPSFAETPAEPVAVTEDPFSASAPAMEEPSPFGGFEGRAAETPIAAPVEGEETYELFAARLRQELAGTENTLSLDDYLSGDIAASKPSPANQIEELTQKLQDAKKITPVIDLSSRSSEGGSTGGTNSGFVTPTLAEIYVKQGWYDDAIRAYKTLATTKPEEKEKYEKRIAELEELKKQQS